MSSVDLRDDARSEQLRHDAIQRGYLKDTQPDRLNFFAGIAHAMRVATSNPCGLLRTLVEKGLWHFLTQADEDKALRRLQRDSEEQETQHAAQVCQAFFANAPAPEDTQEAEHPLALSQDAEIFQVYTRHLNARLPNGLKSVQEQGHLLDWSPERWDRALLELSQARLMRARQQDAATSLQGLQERSVDSCDDAQRDWTFCEEEREIFTQGATAPPCSCSPTRRCGCGGPRRSSLWRSAARASPRGAAA